MKQKAIELKEETHKSTIVVRDFNIPFGIIARTSRQSQQRFRKLEQFHLTFIEYSIQQKQKQYAHNFQIQHRTVT